MDRPEPPEVAGERETLAGFLDYQRATLAWKCEGLTPEQLVRRAVPTSALSLLGLVRHLAEVEYGWFGDPESRSSDGIWCSESEPNADFDVTEADEGVVAEAFERWRAEIARADAVIANTDFGTTYTRVTTGWTFSLRWLMAHMIEEYARHNGHADLLREAIDGATGE
jgi:hypothetical protein